MTNASPSATGKAHLDDLLTTMGITREQLMDMTADDLFTAATQWQAASTNGAEARSFVFPDDGLLDGLRCRPVGPSSSN